MGDDTNRALATSDEFREIKGAVTFFKFGYTLWHNAPERIASTVFGGLGLVLLDLFFVFFYQRENLTGDAGILVVLFDEEFKLSVGQWFDGIGMAVVEYDIE